MWEWTKKASRLFVWTYDFIGKNQSDIFLKKNIGKNLLSVSKLAQSSLFCLESLRYQINFWRRTLKIQVSLVVHVALSCSSGTWNYCQYSPRTPLTRVNCGRQLLIKKYKLSKKMSLTSHFSILSNSHFVYKLLFFSSALPLRCEKDLAFSLWVTQLKSEHQHHFLVLWKHVITVLIMFIFDLRFTSYFHLFNHYFVANFQSNSNLRTFGFQTTSPYPSPKQRHHPQMN